MVATGLCFIAVTGIVKYSAQDLPAAEAAFLRYVLGLVFLLPVLGAIRADWPTGREMGRFAARGLAHALAVILWFHAMTRLPVAEVTAMNYLAPVYVTLGAAVFLRERLAWRRLAAVAVAFAGMLVILRPGFRVVETGHLAMLGAGLLFGASYLFAKSLSARHSAGVVVAQLSIWVTLGLAPFALAAWRTPTVAEVAWMGLVACFATLGHWTMTRAFAAAPVAVTQPVAFLQLVWAVLLGWALFAEAPDGWVIAGGLVIVGAVSALAWREAVLRRTRAA
ncbi:DMT family transporter [Jannaschia sp. Os4]|nr:DMT family transporter [Jannaschia sp. Os4]